ncbi:hypothetical protein [Streptomyces sp. ISL-86]|nr:hypothetical protein [Streptomyces sp. ISL-86]
MGAPYPWAGVTTVLCAGSCAVLAGVALMYRDRPREGGAGEGA